MTPAEPNANQKQWIVRKSGEGFSVLGPYWTDQVRLMVEQGMLEADDELCAENSYWFALHEVAEVKRNLGIENVPLRRPGLDEESTQPDLETTAPELDMPPETVTESTAMIKVNRPPKPAKAAAATPLTAPVSAGELASRFKRISHAQYLGYANAQKTAPALRIEKGRFWSILFLIGVLLAGLGVVWVLKSLKV